MIEYTLSLPGKAMSKFTSLGAGETPKGNQPYDLEEVKQQEIFCEEVMEDRKNYETWVFTFYKAGNSKHPALPNSQKEKLSFRTYAGHETFQEEDVKQNHISAKIGAPLHHITQEVIDRATDEKEPLSRIHLLARHTRTEVMNYLLVVSEQGDNTRHIFVSRFN